MSCKILTLHVSALNISVIAYRILTFVVRFYPLNKSENKRTLVLFSINHFKLIILYANTYLINIAPLYNICSKNQTLDLSGLC